MEEFLKEHKFSDIAFFLAVKGVTEENFFSFNGTEMFMILKNYPRLSEFMMYYFKEKSKRLSDCDVIQEDMEVDISHNIVPVPVENLTCDATENKNHSNSSHSFQDCMTVESIATSFQSNSAKKGKVNNKRKSNGLPPDFKFVENDLYRFLSAPDNIDGQIVLGKYFREGICDYNRLCDTIIKHRFQNNPTFTIPTADFINYANQFKELFPTEEKTRFFEPYINDGRTAASARAQLYNHYKYERGQLRRAGLLSDEKEETQKEIEEAEITTSKEIQCITAANQEEYTQMQILETWNASFAERIAILDPPPKSKKKATSIDKYFNSFPCLCPPLAIPLLQSDFKLIIEGLIKRDIITKSDQYNYYSTILCTAWPEIAKKILTVAKKSKASDCKFFFEEHSALIDAGTHDSVLALLLLPIYMNVAKVLKKDQEIRKVTDKETEDGREPEEKTKEKTKGKATANGREKESVSHSITLTKREISRSFILQIERSEDIDDKRDKFEAFLREYKKEVLPYVILSGSSESNNQAYVCVNKELYLFGDVIKAVETCCKCLIALHKRPFICDFVWIFIQKYLYEIEPKRSFSAVDKLISELNKI